eukprot:g2939.t1
MVGEYADVVVHTFTEPQAVCQALKVCGAPPEPPPTPPPPPTGDGVPMAANLSDTSGSHTWPSWSRSRAAGATGYYLHITDIHLDESYVPGASIDCGLPLCCRSDSGAAANASDAAGFWGTNKAGKDSGCDTPPWMIDDALAKLANEIARPLDFILYTGDSPAHNIWEQSRAKNMASIDKVTALFSKYFPDVPVLSALGNHEAFPVDQYEGREGTLTSGGGDTWLYQTIATDWAHWLPDQALKTLKYGGFYAARAMPNLVVIAMNNNMFQEGDWWWSKNLTDVNHQFPFLQDALRQTRDLGLKAIIIGHQHGLDSVWESRLHDIIHAYKDVIIGQHYGHAHAAFTCAFHDYGNSTVGSSSGGLLGGQDWPAQKKKLGTPLHSVYIGNSVTTYSELNPAFAIFHYDRSLPGPNIAHDYEEYWLDLDVANAGNSSAGWLRPAWRATEEYELPDVHPASWVALSERMRTDKALHQKWITNRNKGVVKSASADPTGDVCGLAVCDQGAFEACSGLTHQRPQIMEHKC